MGGEADVHAGRPGGVPLRVGDGLADHPVDRGRHLGGQLVESVEVQPDGQPDRGAAGGEGSEVIDRGRRRQRAVLPAAEGADQPAHRTERLPAGGFDVYERLPGLVRLIRPHLLGGLGLHDDPGDVVRDDVVQLAGDRQPLVLAHAVEVAPPVRVDPAEVEADPGGDGEPEPEHDRHEAARSRSRSAP